MPFTRISLLAGKPPSYISAIVESLNYALVESFDVPEGDLFAAIHHHQPGDLVFDRDYRGGPRSSDYVFFHITTGKQRSQATKQRFYRHLTELLSSKPGIRPEDVMISLVNSTFDDWSFASGISASSEALGGSE